MYLHYVVQKKEELLYATNKTKDKTNCPHNFGGNICNDCNCYANGKCTIA